MTLSKAQAVFLINQAKLVLWVKNQGWELTGGELYRPEAMADLYAQQGIGIKNSLHIKKLAIDLNLLVGGVLSLSIEAYKPLGDYWKSLDPLNHWGGDFVVKNDQGIFVPKPDSDHFEMRFVEGG